MTGIVKMISSDRGFGFIAADGLAYFWHRSDCAEGPAAFHDFREGDRVTFEPVDPQPERGRRAGQVRLLEEAGTEPTQIEGAAAEDAIDWEAPTPS